MWKDFDSGIFDGDDKGRRGSSSVSQIQARRRVRDKQADDGNTADVEEKDSYPGDEILRITKAMDDSYECKPA
jgi:hypothetical protein